MADLNSGLKRKSILLVDDDNVSLLYLRTVISEFNVNIFEARNGQEAIEVFDKNRDISLVLMDIVMPIMNGMEAVRVIKIMNCNTKIIAQTALAMSFEKETILKEGYDDYICKPLSRKMIINVVNRYL